jgi:hypothetical protein
LFLAFAAVCTAGILYPMDWIMGIRLAKEDELAGLDLAGKIKVILYKILQKTNAFLAHGENWEITASRKVSDLVKKILEEQGDNKGGPVENGTFELHFNPNDSNRRSYKIPLPALSPSAQKQTDEQIMLQSKTSDISRF